MGRKRLPKEKILVCSPVRIPATVADTLTQLPAEEKKRAFKMIRDAAEDVAKLFRLPEPQPQVEQAQQVTDAH